MKARRMKRFDKREREIFKEKSQIIASVILKLKNL